MRSRTVLVCTAFALVSVLSFSGSGGDAIAQPRPQPNIPPPAPPSPTAGRWVAIDVESPAPTPSFTFARTHGVWTARLFNARVQVQVRAKAGDPVHTVHAWASRAVTFMLPQARDEQPTMVQLMGCFAADSDYTIGGRMHDVMGPPKLPSGPAVLWSNMRYLFDGVAIDDVKITSTEIEIRLNHPNLTTFACGHAVALP